MEDGNSHPDRQTRRKRPSPHLSIVHPLKDHGENDPSKTPVETPEDEKYLRFRQRQSNHRCHRSFSNEDHSQKRPQKKKGSVRRLHGPGQGIRTR